jgi:hypothetical protein
MLSFPLHLLLPLLPSFPQFFHFNQWLLSLTEFWWINRWAMEEVRKLQREEEALDSSAVRLSAAQFLFLIILLLSVLLLDLACLVWLNS